MKEIVKEHPLRPIILRFDPKKKSLDVEIKALEAYYSMHDRSWEVKQDLLKHKDTLSEIEFKTIELEYLLLPIKQQLDFLEAAFKLVENPELPLIEEPFTIDIVDFYTDIDRHNEDLIELHKKITEEIHWFNDWADYIYDHETWLDERYKDGDKLIREVFRRYDDVSVDIISLDRDQQEFFGELGNIRKLQQDYFDYGEEVFDQYERVQYESEDAYRRGIRVQQYVNEHFPNKEE